MRTPSASMFFLSSVWISRHTLPVKMVSVDRQRLAVGRQPEALRVALAVAEAVEQRGRGGGIVLALLRSAGS